MDKKLAILIACHKNASQINLLVKALTHSEVDVFLHVDKKSDIRDEIEKATNLYVLPIEKSIDVKWAKISQVRATLNLLEYAQSIAHYDYFIFISGEDYPCKPIDDIVKLADKQENRFQFWDSLNINGQFNHYDKRNSLYFPDWIIGRSLIQKILKRLYIQVTGGYNKAIIKRKNILKCKFYFGSSWWGMTGRLADWMIDYLNKNPAYYCYYSNCMNPDESFFHTLFMLSPYGNLKTDFLTYLKFLPKREGSKYTKNSPEYLNEGEIEAAKKSKYYFMRKIDFNFIDKSTI